MIDASVFHFLFRAVIGWLDRREREALAYLIEENRVLRKQLGGRRLRLSDDDRRRLATSDTLLRWHRPLVARKWTYATRGAGRRGVVAEIRQLVGRTAAENPTLGVLRKNCIRLRIGTGPAINSQC